MKTLDLFRLEGRTAFVSGAAGHLGQAMSRALGDAGAHVILNGRDSTRLKDFAAQLPSAEIAPFDITDTVAVRAYFAGCRRLDVLVNNAVTMTPRPFDELQPEDFARTYASGVTAAFELARAALPALKAGAVAAGDASIVNIASMYAAVSPDARLYSKREQASPFHYGPVKAALLQLTRHLASEFAPERIRVNAIVPGPFPRPSIQRDDPDFAARLAGRTMLGRLGVPDEMRGPLLFLASHASGYVTGTSLLVDGGWTAW